jgi:hypothetical protein
VRWLIHGNLTPAVLAALERHEQSAMTAVEAGVEEGAAPSAVLEAARVQQFELITADKALVDYAVTSPGKFNRLIVYLQLAGEDIEQDDAVDRLFDRYKRLTHGRLYTVTENRVKIRQLPGSRGEG